MDPDQQPKDQASGDDNDTGEDVQSSILGEAKPESAPDKQEGEEEDKGEGDSKADENAGEKKPPEDYDFKFPEGFKPNEEMMTEFKKVAKETGLTQESAQKLVDLNLRMSQKQHDEQIALNNEVVEGWKEETKKVFGKDYQQRLAYAAKGRDALGSPEVMKLLDVTGLGNNVHFIMMFEKAGKVLSEDSLPGGKPTNQEDLSGIPADERLARRIAKEQAGK